MAYYKFMLSSIPADECDDCHKFNCSKLHPVGACINLNKFYSYRYDAFDDSIMSFEYSTQECVNKGKGRCEHDHIFNDGYCRASGWDVLEKISFGACLLNSKIVNLEKLTVPDNLTENNYKINEKYSRLSHYRKPFVIDGMNRELYFSLFYLDFPEELMDIIFQYSKIDIDYM